MSPKLVVRVHPKMLQELKAASKKGNLSSLVRDLLVEAWKARQSVSTATKS